MRLDKLSCGDEALVIDIEKSKPVLARLLAMGLSPGVKLRVRDTSPCFIIEVGNAEIALDRSLAEAVSVQVLHRRRHS